MLQMSLPDGWNQTLAIYPGGSSLCPSLLFFSHCSSLSASGSVVPSLGQEGLPWDEGLGFATPSQIRKINIIALDAAKRWLVCRGTRGDHDQQQQQQARSMCEGSLALVSFRR